MSIEKKSKIVGSILVLIAISAVFIMACSKENKPYLYVPDIHLKGANCFGTAAGNIKAYFSGQSSIEEAGQIWPCYKYALDTYRAYVRGQNLEHYKPAEIRGFVEKFFLKISEKNLERGEHLISDQLLVDLMALKTVFLGGNTDVISRDEFEFVLSFLDTMQSETINMWPHTKVVFGRSEEAPSKEDFDAGVNQFEKSLMSLVSHIGPKSSEYAFDRMESLFVELNLFLSKLNGDNEISIDWGKYIPSLAQAKRLFLNSDPEKMHFSDWPKLAEILTQGFRSGLFYRFYLKGPLFTDKIAFLNFDQFMDEMLVLFYKAFSFRDNKPIRDEEAEGLISALANLNVLPFEMKAESAINVWQAIVSKLLNPQNKFGATNFDYSKFNYLVSEYKSWVNIQNLIFDNKEDLSDPRWLEMKEILERQHQRGGHYQVNLNSKSNILLDGMPAVANLPTATRLNWERAVFSGLFRGYVQDPERLKIGSMTQEELHEVFLGMRPILVGMGLVAQDNISFDKKIFRDANLFMPSSNGNENLEFHESVDYLHFVLAGINSGQQFVKSLDESCRPNAEEVDIVCFRNEFRNRSQVSLEHLPSFLNFSKSLPLEKWNQIIENLEVINRDNGATDTPIAKAEVYESFVLLQYLEVVMLNYDVDRSGDYNLDETLKLVWLFRGIFKNILGLDYEDELDRDRIEAFFTYMIKTEAMPDSLDPLTTLRLLNWRLSRAEWTSLRPNRGTLLKILALIKSNTVYQIQ